MYTLYDLPIENLQQRQEGDRWTGTQTYLKEQQIIKKKMYKQETNRHTHLIRLTYQIRSNELG